MKKPMLAYNRVPKMATEVEYPCMASYKYDGIRCMVQNGKLVSRNLKPIPNLHINLALTRINLDLGGILEGFDGELMVRGARDFNAVQSAVMSAAGAPDFYFAVYDIVNLPNLTFEQRNAVYQDIIGKIHSIAPEYSPYIKPVTQHIVRSSDVLEELYQLAISKGYEGLITKKPSGAYKHGRSTLKQQLCLKFKQELEDEGVIVDFVELNHNLDTSCKKKENMVPGNTLGAFVVQWNGVQFEVGTGIGMTHHFRQYVWDNQDKFMHKRLTFKYQELSANGVPRIPRYKVIRDERV